MDLAKDAAVLIIGLSRFFCYFLARTGRRVFEVAE